MGQRQPEAHAGVHNRTDTHGVSLRTWVHVNEGTERRNTMLLSVLAVILTLGVYVTASRVHSSPIPARLGWMSDQWLAEYRALHAS